MCGILGIIQNNKHIEHDLFTAMLSTLEKRGPDQSDVYIEKNLALGHRRLSIIDLSSAGKQPMRNEDGSVIISYNGEIYNYLQLKSSLKNQHTWTSKTDTEVLLHAYEDYGKDIVHKIEGMFAFAIYDKNQQIITLARDHFGKKPLYYYLDENIFCFASELKAIIKNPEIKAKIHIDDSSLTKYLFYGYIPSPHSILKEIKKLEPATVMQFDIANWRIITREQYWSIENIPVNNSLTETEILEQTEYLIKKSIEKRLMADVPLGVFLSGGVDSSLLCAYLARFSPQVNSFTVCYKNSPEADESAYAERVAKKLGINYNLCYFEDSLVKENFIEILDYLDEPMADAAIIPLYYVAKFAKNNITVVLSGDGGDELFGGYPKYQAQKFIHDLRFLRFLGTIGKPFFNKNSVYYKLLDGMTLPFAQRQFIFGSGSFLKAELHHLLNVNTIDMRSIFQEASAYADAFAQKDIINKSLYLDCKIQLPDWYLVKGDRATMATSLEMRNPLLDKDLSEFAFSLGGKWKIKEKKPKFLLKKLAEKYIDHDIIYRNKSGFGVPLDTWIRHELKDLFNDYLYHDNEFFNKNYIKQLHNEHMSGKADHRFKLLRIFNFNYWMRKYD